MNSKQIQVGFYLAVFEMEYCNIPGIKRLEEMYDLRELAGIASCEEIEFFNI